LSLLPFSAEKPDAVLRHAAELYRLLSKSSRESGALASEYLHGRKHVSPSDKALISSLAFTALRNRTLVEHAARHALAESPGDTARHGDEEARWRILAALLLATMRPAAALIEDPQESVAPSEPFLPESTTSADLLRAIPALAGNADSDVIADRVIGVIAQSRKAADASIRHADASRAIAECSVAASMPEWILTEWMTMMPARSAASLAQSLCHEAPVDLRVNLSRATRDDTIAALGEEGIAASPARWAPGGIRLASRRPVMTTRAYREGWIEIQDEGSQLIAPALAPAPGWRILDACAGAGGKSLHLADLQRDHGAVDARDIDGRKLRALMQRARRCAMHSITTATPTSEGRGGRVPRTPGTDHYDAVLIDAPCSGLGTARRSPMMKWRLTPRMLERITATQRSILAAHAARVAPGGTLVYSTCSLMPDENQKIADWFLDAFPAFRPDPLRPAYQSYGVALPGLGADEYMVTLRPDVHGTDGFFIARFRYAP
jgi:16S rRNA (cytosine967-C5)-methyltransferase